MERPDTTSDDDLPSLPQALPNTPKTFQDVQLRMLEFKDRCPTLLSSPSAARFRTVVKGYDTTMAKATLDQADLIHLKQAFKDIGKRKLTSRRSIQVGGALSVQEAKEKIRRKHQLAQESALKKARLAIPGRLSRLKKIRRMLAFAREK